MTLRRGGARAYLWLTLFGLAAAVVLVRGAAAEVAESCVYDAGTKTVTATITTGGQATLIVSGGQLQFGALPAACGAATTTNTDTINVAGEAGSNETLIFDQRGGVFGPGAAAESNVPEIEMFATLGDATDRVIVYGTEGPDHFAAGQNGFATSTDGDVDWRFTPGAFKLDVHLLGGDDYFNGRGESGAGLHFLGPIVVTGGNGNESLLRGSSEPDSIDGGAGNDVLRGQEANDILTGGPGADDLGGGADDDSMTGGPGFDLFTGSGENDEMFARDGEVDASINGGPGTDTAHIDAADPAPLATETVIRPGESCDFDGISHTLALELTPASTATLVVVGGAIWFGEIPQPCGTATTTNIDSISIAGHAGTNETLILDHRGGIFGPGLTPEHNTPEIEITTALGDETDRLIIYGTQGDDYMAAGQNGIATSIDGDVDFTFSPNTFRLETHMLGGDDLFDARGTGGAGLKFLGPLIMTGGDGDDFLRGSAEIDSIDGGPGNDSLDAQDSDDIMIGGPGDDTFAAGSGADSIDGGPGVDTMNGSDGDDTFYAQDDEADAFISGGAGADTAYIDTGIDPRPITVETVFGDGDPPPPPPPSATGCTYDAATKIATATLTGGATATLVVSGTQLRFGTLPVACGAATTTNTDSIVVNGAAGSAESLTLDLAGGPFAPGATSETGSPEIEIALQLGDDTDRLTIMGTAAADMISIGINGLAFNIDSDLDVTLSSIRPRIDVFGLGGANTLSGRGGYGTGSDYPENLVLRAGGFGDVVEGGAGNDQLHGGTGNDTLSGRTGNDTIDGAGGNDALTGNAGDDTLIGGAGLDSLIGGDADDILRADDDEADTLLNGGPGNDTVYYDDGIDPTAVAVEIRIPA